MARKICIIHPPHTQEKNLKPCRTKNPTEELLGIGGEKVFRRISMINWNIRD